MKERQAAETGLSGKRFHTEGQEKDTMKEQWFVIAKKADFQAIAAKFGIDQVAARIIRNRGITGEEAIAAYLDSSEQQLHDPHLLKDADKGAGILAEKIAAGKKIRIIGDYDIDGVNASYILLTGLRECGALADQVIPDRVHDGYGMNCGAAHVLCKYIRMAYMTRTRKISVDFL